ncbi:transposase family protein [Spiroplasma poulsonii]|uniref:transposase family protein n=1 Tax=Spiroplasma poulsonii TaxID=2138 RepID=UPI003A5C7A89
MIKLLLLMLPKLQSNAQKKDKNNQSYSGKKKKHTIKTQVIIEQETKKIIATSFSLGKKHDDYALFKESKIPILKKYQINSW